MTALLVCSSSGLATVVAPVSAHPNPGNTTLEHNGLTTAEVLTLWSGDHDHGISPRETQNSSAIQTIAAETDLSYTAPPQTAATWTANDFADLTAGGTQTSIAPVHAKRVSGTYIRDAHATVFAIQPSTRAHLSRSRTAWYIAPEGAVRALVDYRVRVPKDQERGNTSIDWDLIDHEVDRVELSIDDTVVAQTADDQTPILSYTLSGEPTIEPGSPTNLTLRATISATLRRTRTVENRTNGTTRTTVSSTTRTEALTVSQTIPVVIYELSPRALTGQYPNGDRAVLIASDLPWQGAVLGIDGSERIRGVWRFYTARDQRWEALLYTNADGTTRRHSPAHPVVVHAYPSRLGPRAEPIRDGPTIQHTWGDKRSSPAFPSTIQVETVERTYNRTEGVVARTESLSADGILVRGLVRGETQRVQPSEQTDRTIRPSTLSVRVLHANRTGARLRLTLRDARTGVPIVLAEQRETDRDLLDGQIRTGTIRISGQRVETNASGVTTLWVTQPGAYTAVYEPGAWYSHEPAYTGDRATVRWHPLWDSGVWLDTLTALASFAITVLVVFYGVHRLALLFTLQHWWTE